MYIAKNIQYLRKRDKITQEDLAEKLNVSRQSVSKWETGEAYPETEKLLAICDLFDVSLDGLMRSDLTVQNDTHSENNSGNENDSSSDTTVQPTTEYEVFEKHINSFSRGIAIGVMLILLGIALCIALSGLSMVQKGSAAALTSIMSVVAVILFTAGAIFLFVLYGQSNEKFKRENASVEKPSAKTEHKGFGAAMAGLISGILIDVVFLIVMTALIDTQIIKSSNADTATCYVVAAFMAVLAILVGGLVYLGIQHTKYEIDKYNNQIKQSKNPTQIEKIAEAISGAIMLSATAIFLLLGFLGGYWHPGWVAFPIGGILCAIINTIIKAKK